MFTSHVVSLCCVCASAMLHVTKDVAKHARVDSNVQVNTTKTPTKLTFVKKILRFVLTLKVSFHRCCMN